MPSPVTSNADRNLLNGRDPPFASLPDDRPRRRFRLFDFLKAPFRDLDERAVKRLGHGRLATPRGAATPAPGPVRAATGLGPLGEGNGPIRIPVPGPLAR